LICKKNGHVQCIECVSFDHVKNKLFCTECNGECLAHPSILTDPRMIQKMRKPTVAARKRTKRPLINERNVASRRY
jgi:hypothetical protein